MKLEDIEVAMRVRVRTVDGDDDYEEEVGEVIYIYINKDLPYPIEVDFNWAIECFKPEDLEEFN